MVSLLCDVLREQFNLMLSKAGFALDEWELRAQPLLEWDFIVRPDYYYLVKA